jgi:hypothetical protein
MLTGHDPGDRSWTVDVHSSISLRAAARIPGSRGSDEETAVQRRHEAVSTVVGLGKRSCMASLAK